MMPILMRSSHATLKENGLNTEPCWLSQMTFTIKRLCFIWQHGKCRRDDMKLHLDRDAFGVLLEDIHSRTGYRTDVLRRTIMLS